LVEAAAAAVVVALVVAAVCVTTSLIDCYDRVIVAVDTTTIDPTRTWRTQSNRKAAAK
jgi:hypothetical protein